MQNCHSCLETEATSTCQDCECALCDICRCEFDDETFSCRQCADQICIAESGFCYDCVTKSEDETAGDTFSGQIFSHEFVGFSDTCPTCDSDVRTEWFVFVVFPIYPKASYRVQMITKNGKRKDIATRYLSRRIPLHREQIKHTRHQTAMWTVGVVLVIFTIGYSIYGNLHFWTWNW